MTIQKKEIIIKKLKDLPFISTASSVAEKMGVGLFVVGGYVRDMLLNKEKNEIDFLVVGNGPRFAEKFAFSLGIKNVSI